MSRSRPTFHGSKGRSLVERVSAAGVNAPERFGSHVGRPRTLRIPSAQVGVDYRHPAVFDSHRADLR